MKIKAKLILGVGLLFAMIVLLTSISSIFIYKLSGDTKNILVSNYNTLDHSRQMMITLDRGIGQPGAVDTFLKYLTKQQQNVTEVGEQELTDKLTDDFSALQKAPGDPVALKLTRKGITDIMLLNMQAIQRKSAIAQKTSDVSILWISITGAICFLIAFTLLINLPGNISNPVRELTNSIKEIAAQNYSQRVHFEKHNEFGDLAAAFNTMAQKLQEYKAGNVDKLLMEKKRIETLINNMNDPVIGVDENNKVLFMNDTALRITGLKDENIIGKRIQDIAVRNDLVRSLIQDLFTGDMNNMPGVQSPVKIYADNKESYFEKEVIPIKIIPTGEKNEKLIGNVILLQNVTPYKELDFAKTNFIATVSHELKTPISAIRMSLQLLENKQVGALNEDQQGLVSSIKDDTTRLLKITGELLNMTQVEAGSMQLNLLPVQPAEILDYAVGANKTAAEQKQIKLTLNIMENLPRVLADNEKTAWVLTNLISNAIRYSHDDSVVELSIKEERSQVIFTVRDAGQGIDPQYMDKIFDRYFRIPGTKKEGTGLGLSISKEFIEAQKGKLSVRSEVGAGSTFSVSLPAYE